MRVYHKEGTEITTPDGRVVRHRVALERMARHHRTQNCENRYRERIWFSTHCPQPSLTLCLQEVA